MIAACGCGWGRGTVDRNNLWGEASSRPVFEEFTPGAAAAATPRAPSPPVNNAPDATHHNAAGHQHHGGQNHNAPNHNPPYVTPHQVAYQTPPGNMTANNIQPAVNAPYVTPQTPGYQAPASPPPYQAPPATSPFANQSAIAHGPQNPPLQYAPQVVQPTAPYESRVEPSGPNPPANGAPGSQASTLEKFEPARIVAQVGQQYILAGDVLGAVNQMIEPHKDKMPEDVLKQQKELLVQRMVKQMIDTKLLYNSFLQEVPPDRLEEALGNIRQQAFAQYDEMELEGAMKKAKVNSPAELDAYLRTFGTSLYKQKIQFMELQLGRTAIRQNINANPEITHQEMLDYYREHGEDYDFPAKARWEKLTTRHDKFPDRTAARYAIGVLGDQVRLGGAPLSAVAKRGSQGLDNEEGGYHDWTTRGSLRSTKLDEAIFNLPPGLLSDIIEDETGFHIVRVIERREAGRTPFVEAQVKIRDKLLAQKRQQQIKDYLNKLRKETDVWTVFDDAPDAKQASTPAATARR